MSDYILCLASDPHWTGDSKDEYRKDFFNQIREVCVNENVHSVVLGGDLTEKKDHHPAELVNWIVDETTELANDLPGCLFILPGNHDGRNRECPYFRFMRTLTGVVYIERPETISGEFPRDLLFLPFSDNPTEDWKNIDVKDKVVFAHVTVDGAFTESGYQLESQVKSEFFKDAALAFSGDIHKPQELEHLIYIGSPYNVRFGDNFDNGGCIILNLNTLEWKRITLDFPRKLTFDISTENDLAVQLRNVKEQQKIQRAFVKVRLHVTHENLGKQWEIRDKCVEFLKQSGYEWVPIEIVTEFKNAPISVMAPQERKYLDFDTFCKSKGISEELVAAGKTIIEEVP